MRDCTACSLQGILICYFGSFPVWATVLPVLFKEFLFAILDLSPVWEMKLPLLFKDFFVAILDLSLYERWSCPFPSRISYLLFWSFPCMRDETASSLQRFLICYFGSFPVWEMKMPLLFKEILFAILDLSMDERWNCLFSSRFFFLLFWIFPCMRDCTACSLQGILICHFGSFPVWETVLPVLFKEFLFVILDLSLYEILYCVFSSRNSYLLFWIFAGMRDCTACCLQGILICYFGSFPVWETVLPVLFKEFLIAIVDLSLYERLYCVFSSRNSYLLFLYLSLYERLYCLFSSRNSYLLFWIFPCMRDCTACSLQGILICYFGSFPVWETVLCILLKEFLFAILDLFRYERLYCLFSSRILICYFGSFPVWETVLPVLFKEFLIAIVDLSLYERLYWVFSSRNSYLLFLYLSLYERLYCLFSSRNSYLLFWTFPCMRDCTACYLRGILICYFGSFPVWEMKLPLLFKDFLVAILDLSLNERWSCLFPSRISDLLFWIFPCMRDCTTSSLQGILICYFLSLPVWEMKMPLLLKDILFAILDLSLYARWDCLFSSRIPYLLFSIFPCMRDENASSLQGYLICYFGSFLGWEMKLLLLFKEFLFAILDLSLYERWNCLFSSRISYSVFWIFPHMRDEAASSLQGFLICYFGYFPVWETVLPLLFKEFLFPILDLSL